MNTSESIDGECEVDTYLVNQCEHQVNELNKELADVSHEILLLEHDDEDLSQKKTKLSKAMLNTCLQIRCLLQGQVMTRPIPAV